MKKILTLCSLLLCTAFTLHAADEAKPQKPGGGKGGERARPEPEAIFKKLDANNDSSVSKEEFLAGPRAKQDPAKAAERFKTLDKNNDGKLSLEEFKAGMSGGRKGGDGKPAPKKPAESK
jgi:hypothetical protein